jgi:hypothetical protein
VFYAERLRRISIICFLHCSFTQKVWQHILQQLSLSFHWTGASFPECFATWTFDLAAPPTLAVHVCWHLWKERNKTLFEDILPSYRSVCYRIISSFHWQLPLTSRFFTKRLISLCLLAIQWHFLMEQPNLQVVAAEREASSRCTRRGRLSGFYVVAGAPIQRQNCLAFGRPSCLPPFGLWITSRSLATPKSSLTGSITSAISTRLMWKVGKPKLN